MKKLEHRLTNLRKAIESLERSVATPPIEERDYGGIVKAFETAFETT